MTEPIMMSPADIGHMFIVFCAAIATVAGAVAALVKLYNFIRKPEKKQNDRLDNIENELKTINKRLEDGNKRFQSDKEQVDDLETRMDETNLIIIKTLQALTSHAIDGNNTDKLVEANRELNNYLLGQLRH